MGARSVEVEAGARGSHLRLHSRGFSLVELMLTLAIVVLAMGMGFAVAREGRGHMSVDQVARQLLADLRWARQQAMTQGVPAGILLPGATAAGQAYDVVEADVDAPGAMRVVRTEDWSADGHYAVLAVGTWGGLPFQPGDGTSPGRPDSSAQTFLTQCAKTWPGRYVMFGANGTVTTSGVPSANGEHYLVVTAGLQESGGSLDAVWWPASTVRLSANGYADVVNGVPSHPNMQSGSPRIPTLGSLPPDLPPGPLQYPKPYAPPTIVKLDVLPTANEDTLPPGAVLGSTYSLAPNGRMSLTVTAQDPNGDALYCNWYSSAVLDVPAGVAPKPPDRTDYDSPFPLSGRFSVSGIQPMAFVGTRGQWTDGVEWSPPPTAKPGDWFELGVVIDDLRGGKDARWIVVGMIQPGTISFMTTRDGSQDNMFVMNSDGTDQRRLTSSGSWTSEGDLSPDGMRLVYASNESGTAQIYLTNVDGTGRHRLTHDSFDDEDPQWSPDGTKIVYAWRTRLQICTIGEDGTGEVKLPNTFGAFGPHWSPDGKRISFQSDRTGNWNVYVVNADGSNLIRLTRGKEDYAGPWSPDGTKMAFLRDGPNGRQQIFVMNADGSGQLNLTGDAAYYESPCWSPDGTRIAFSSNRSGVFEIYTMLSNGAGQTQLTRISVNMWPSWSR